MNTWDYDNRLTSSVSPSTTINYAYDQTGQRVKKTENGKVSIYPNKLYNIEDGKIKKHIFAGDNSVATIDDGKLIYHHTDHLSGSSVETDKDGLVVEAIDYYPFGSVRTDNQYTTYENDKKFTGYELDENDLYYAGQRYYNSDIGRFVSQDPVLWSQIESFAKDHQQMNFYTYARNNPLLFVDPTGETAQEFMNGMVMGYGRGGYNTISSVVKNPTSIVTGPFMALGQLYSDGYNSALSLGGQMKNGGVSSIYSGVKADASRYSNALQNMSDTQKGEMVGYSTEKMAEAYVFSKAASKVSTLEGYSTKNSIGIKGEKYGVSVDKFPGAQGAGITIRDFSKSSNYYKTKQIGFDYHNVHSVWGKQLDTPMRLPHVDITTGNVNIKHFPFNSFKK